MKILDYYSMENRALIHVDLLDVNVSWIPEDLEPFENEFDFLVSMVCTMARFITLAMAIVVHRAFYRCEIFGFCLLSFPQNERA